jgi:hypothetical protein
MADDADELAPRDAEVDLLKDRKRLTAACGREALGKTLNSKKRI